MHIQVAELVHFSNRCLVRAGVPEHEAQLITNTMIEADARGIHSHGLMRLPVYIERMNRGLIRTVSRVEVVQESGATAILDGHCSAGQVVASRAMELTIAKAAQYGIGAVSARNSNHFGIAAHYALEASRHNMIGIVMSNTAPLMPPTGGAEKILGNNPLAIAAPAAGKYPLLLDMALSNAALGKVLFARTQGVSIPEGWGVDRKGRPTTDPDAVLDGGFILPVGGPKGFGLALMIELLTGVLADSSFSKMIPSMYDLTQKQSISHYMLVIDVNRFLDPDRFRNLAALLSSYVKQAFKAEGVSELYLPGEIEFEAEERRMREGIPVDASVREQLDQLAQSLQLPGLCEE